MLERERQMQTQINCIFRESGASPLVAKDFSQSFCEAGPHEYLRPQQVSHYLFHQFTSLSLSWHYFSRSIPSWRHGNPWVFPMIVPLFTVSCSFFVLLQKIRKKWQLLIWPRQQLKCWFDQMWTDLTAAGCSFPYTHIDPDFKQTFLTPLSSPNFADHLN